MKKEAISFKPKAVTKALLQTLGERASDVLEKRYGLGSDAKKQTLEAIGKKYKITRERVRQIENFSLESIRKSEQYEKNSGNLEELRNLISFHGGIVHETEFLSSVSKEKSTQNHLHFLLVVGEAFTKIKEDEEFYDRWTVDEKLAERVHGSLRRVCKTLAKGGVVSEDELISNFLGELKDVVTNEREDRAGEMARDWLELSKGITANPLGEWGLADSPEVKMRGIKDYAYLVLKKHGSPLHFAEVAKSIENNFGKKAHPATCHNELIKDKRFVLVGRGLYALTDWGYKEGVVRDVIREILKNTGPLSREEIIDRVMKERYVKPNTIVVNLQNPKYFKRDKEGVYIAL